GIGVLAVVLDGGKLLFVRPAAKKILHAAYEEHLERRHERWGAGTVEDFGEIVFTEIEFEETEIAQVRRDEMFEDRVAESLAEESFVAYEDVCRTHIARLKFADEAFGLGKGSHS